MVFGIAVDGEKPSLEDARKLVQEMTLSLELWYFLIQSEGSIERG